MRDAPRGQHRFVLVHPPRGGADEQTLQRAVSQAEQLGQQMTELVLRGIAHRCKLTVTEVS